MSVQKKLPKNQRAKRALHHRAPKLIENTKSSIVLRGSSTSQIVQDALKDLHMLRSPHSRNMPKKTELRPFENNVSIEFLAQKNDASLWVLGSHSKKRPHNLTFGRMYDGHVLDILEFGLENYKGLHEFRGEQPNAGGKPCFYVCGDEWDSTPALATTKNMLIDFFRGTVTKKVNMNGVDRALMATLENGKIHMRHYLVRRTKAKSGTDKAVALTECGPSFTLVPRRTAIAADALMKQATRRPTQLKQKKEKNKETNAFAETIGRLHMEKQDLEKLQTRKMKGLKRKFEADDKDDEDDDGEVSA